MKRWHERVLTAASAASLTFFAVLAIKGLRTSRANDWAALYFVIPLLGSILGISRVRQLAPRYRIVPILFRCGMFMWAVGSFVWLYYNVRVHESIPYPSWADAAYLFALAFWTIAIILLYKQVRGYKVIQDLAHLIPTIIFAISVTGIFIAWAHGGALSRFSPGRDILKYLLDMSYPIVDAFNLALFGTLLVTKKTRKATAIKKGLVAIFCGYVMVFFSDLLFNVTTSLPPESSVAYYNGGATDAMFAVAFYAMSLGLLNMPPD
jgi:hypothetical protein